MKQLFLVFLFLTCSKVFSQAGVYVIDHTKDMIDGSKTKWTLTLNEDGTFLYNFYRNVKGGIPAEENFYGKGTWKVEGKIVSFYAKPSDVNDEFSVNLNNSKAKYINKSPRDRTDKIVKTALRFYESETSHITGLELFKE
ncbi:MAG: hypothetical protein WA839_05910 [Flavobacteriaceae bacterium]